MDFALNENSEVGLDDISLQQHLSETHWWQTGLRKNLQAIEQW